MAEQKVLIDNKAVSLSDTKTVISLNQPTPAWVNWFFRIEFVLNKAMLFYLSGDTGISLATLKQTLLILGTIDLAVWGLGRFVGLKKADFEEAG